MFQKYEKVAHLKFPSQGGQNTNISLVYLAHITLEKRLHVSAQSCLQSVLSIQVQFSHIYKGRVSTQLGVGPNYLGTNHFSYPMVLDTETNLKYTMKSDLNPITYKMKLHKTLLLTIIDSLLRTYTRWQYSDNRLTTAQVS